MNNPQGELLAMFPTPLLRKKWTELDNNSKMKSLFLDIEKKFPMDNNLHLTNTYYTSYNKTLDKPLMEYDVMKPFVNFLSDSIQRLNQFMNFDGEHKFKIRDMWFAINRQNSYHESHTHSPAIWSGVYYVQANDKDASLNLYSPTTSDSNWANNVVNEYNDFTTNQAQFTPETGMLNVFPGYLRHSVDQQKVDQDRIAISFNVV